MLYISDKIAAALAAKFSEQLEQIRLFLNACSRIGSKPNVEILQSSYPIFDFRLVGQKQLGKYFVGGELIVSHQGKEIARFRLI